ncbi:MAG TPA: class I SAM-dependent methyltransferase [bacterium]|nr:class I SAM-dependent methyltransferase [bacterium]
MSRPLVNVVDVALDAGIRTAQRVRNALLRSRRGAAFLPGAHGVQVTRVAGEAPDEYLRAGPMHRSLWRTIEWRLVSEGCRGLPRPVADVGCGDGELGQLMFDRVDFGIDGEERSLAHCRELETYEQVVLADVREALGVPDGSLRSVFSNSTFEHITPVDGALAAVARALEPGGRFLFTVPAAGLDRAFARAYGQRVSDRLNTMFGHHNLWTAARWEEKLRAAGFSEVDTRGYMTQEAAAWFAGLHFVHKRRRERHGGEAFWEQNLPRFLRLVRESLEARDEAATVCLLIDARR